VQGVSHPADHGVSVVQVPSTAEPTARGELSQDTRRRFQQRDLTALAEVYDRYQRPVWSVAMSVTRADHLAQEAVQDAFLRAWGAAASYDPTLDLGPWLMTITRRAALDLIRREFRPTRGGHAEEQDGVVEDPGIEQAWTAWQVQEALGRLGDDERDIVRLSFFEDLTHTQIADRLGLPIGTVKSRSYRAHRRLAELLTHLRDDATPPVGNRSPPAERIDSAGRAGEGGGL
jgi:RNA polymerase sigma-70 factor, ECF subfamily